MSSRADPNELAENPFVAGLRINFDTVPEAEWTDQAIGGSVMVLVATRLSRREWGSGDASPWWLLVCVDMIGRSVDFHENVERKE